MFSSFNVHGRKLKIRPWLIVFSLLALLFTVPNPFSWKVPLQITLTRADSGSSAESQDLALALPVQAGPQRFQLDLPQPLSLQHIEVRLAPRFFHEVTWKEIRLETQAGVLIQAFDFHRYPENDWSLTRVEYQEHYRLTPTALEGLLQQEIPLTWKEALQARLGQEFLSKTDLHQALRTLEPPPTPAQRALLRRWMQQPDYRFQVFEGWPRWKSPEFSGTGIQRIILELEPRMAQSLGLWLVQDVLWPWLAPWSLLLVGAGLWQWKRSQQIPVLGVQPPLSIASESAKKALKYMAIFATFAGWLWHGWVLWQTPLYADDIWHRGKILAMSFWELLSQPIFSDTHHNSLHHLWMWLLSAAPVDQPWMHSLQWVLLGGAVLALVNYLRYSGLHPSLSWLAGALYLSTPTIMQPLYWTSVPHWGGALLVLLALLAEARISRGGSWLPWLGAWCALLAAVAFSELMYGAVCFLLLYWLWQYRRAFWVRSGLMLTLAGVGVLIGWRNALITGNWWQLSIERYLIREQSLGQAYQRLHEALAYSQPLALPLRFWPHGYFREVEGSLIALVFLIGLHGLIWGSALKQKPRHGLALFLIGGATPLMIILGRGLVEERYLALTIMAQVMAFVWMLEGWRNSRKRWLFWSAWGLGFALVVFNASITIQRGWSDWVRPAQRFEAILRLAQAENADAQAPLGFVDALQSYPTPARPGEWRTGPSNHHRELMLLLHETGHPACVYELYRTPETAEVQNFLIGHQDAIEDLQKNCLWPPPPMRCQIPTPSGKLAPYQGQAWQVWIPRGATQPQFWPVECR